MIVGGATSSRVVVNNGPIRTVRIASKAIANKIVVARNATPPLVQSGASVGFDHPAYRPVLSRVFLTSL
jgi:hypothetical protein